MPRKKNSDNPDKKAKVNKELEGLDIKVNSLGEIITNYNIDVINEFLNKTVDDKKLRDRDNDSEKDSYSSVMLSILKEPNIEMYLFILYRFFDTSMNLYLMRIPFNISQMS